MNTLAFDRRTGPITIGGRRYPHEPIPDFQTRASEQTILTNAARRVGLTLPLSERELRARFEIRKVGQREKTAIEAHYFGPSRRESVLAQEARRAAADALRRRLLIRDEDGTTVREMTDAEFQLLPLALEGAEDLAGG